MDDDTHIRELVRVFLQTEGFDVAEAADGVQALKQLETVKADLVIVDIMMPNMDGITAIQTLRKMNPVVKIIAISGLITNREAALAAGAQVFLSKPYNLEELLSTVHALIHDSTEKQV